MASEAPEGVDDWRGMRVVQHVVEVEFRHRRPVVDADLVFSLSESSDAWCFCERGSAWAVRAARTCSALIRSYTWHYPLG